MTPTGRLKLIRLMLAFGCALMQCSCSRDHELRGEIFIVTAGHESVKLGLVEIGAFQPAQLNSLIDSVKKKIAEQNAQLAPTSKAVEKLESSAKQKDDDARRKWIYDNDARFHSISGRASRLWIDSGTLASRVKWHSQYLHSAKPFFEVLPRPIAASKSDSDGKFTMKLPRSGEIVLCAAADRKLLDSTEHYYWMVKVNPSANASITLSNDNLATSDSAESLIHATTDSGVKAESIEDLRTELGKLENELHALESDFVAARQTPSPSPAISPKPITTQPATIFAPPPEPSPPGVYVILLRDVQVAHGASTKTIPKGSELLVVARGADVVQVRVGSDSEIIPISAVEFK